MPHLLEKWQLWRTQLWLFDSTRSFEFIQTSLHVQISLAHNYSHLIAFHVRKGKWLPCQFSWVYHAQSKWPRFKHASPLFWPVQINVYTLTNSQQRFDLQSFFSIQICYLQLNIHHHQSNHSTVKSLRNYILNEYTAQHSLNVDWSRSLALSSGLQKSPVKDMVHAPIPPCYLLPLKGWQLHHSESEISSHTWQPRASSFFFHWTAELGDRTDITEFALFPSVPLLSLLLSSEGSVWPPPRHFVVIFNIKYPFRDYLMLLTVYSSVRLHGSY